MTGPASPSINGVEIPLHWHLSAAHIRHLCGSPASVQLAKPEATPIRTRQSAYTLAPDEILPGVTLEAPPLAAPIEVFVETHKAKEDRAKIYAAIREAGQASRADIVRATGLYLQRVIDLTREDEERGILTRLFPRAGRPVLLAMAPPWPKPSKAEVRS